MKDQLEALVAQMYSSGILYSEAVREFKKATSGVEQEVRRAIKMSWE